jgi:GNAT superfamily N-acetyltransferase
MNDAEPFRPRNQSRSIRGHGTVGRDYDWTCRKKLSDAGLAALLNDLRLEVRVLTVEDVPAGFAELDRRIEEEIELVQFGLVPEFIGQVLGRYFLQGTIDKAWSYGPRRFRSKELP